MKIHLIDLDTLDSKWRGIHLSHPKKDSKIYISVIWDKYRMNNYCSSGYNYKYDKV